MAGAQDAMAWEVRSWGTGSLPAPRRSYPPPTPDRNTWDQCVFNFA